MTTSILILTIGAFLMSTTSFFVVSQRNFAFNQNFQQTQQQSQPGFFQQQSKQQFLGSQTPPNSFQTFHQFTVPSSPPSQFHPEQPPQQDFNRPDNELVPTQNPRGREGRNQNNNKRMMSDTCLACLCQASTECKLSTRCISNDEYCGAFLISKPYWTDAQRPTLVGDNPDREEAFIDCAVDPVCSATTVRNYMMRFEKDCNGDGEIDCDDLARIHLMSAFDCTNPKVATTGFYSKFRQCWDRVLQLSQK